MTNKEMFYFTGRCLMLDEVPENRLQLVNMIKTASIDWLKVAAHWSNHLVLPVIFLKFQSHGILKILPSEFSLYLKDIYELNLSRNKKILFQLEDITRILNKNNIYPIFLKGSAHLLDGLYTDIGERILGDIDFLVPSKDYLQSAKIFEAEGYSMPTPFLYFDVATLKHYPPLAKPGFPAYIELHQLLTEDELSWFNFGTIDQEKKEIKTLKGCYVLSDRHKIVHNFVHGQLHHGGHINGIVSFRDLYDLFLLSKRSELQQTLPLIKSRQKAIAYFALTRKALGLQDNFFSGSNFSSWLLFKKHDLNLRSSLFYHTFRGFVFISQRIWIRYIGLFVKLFYSKTVRKSFINRISDPHWYRAHLESYITFFARKKNVNIEK